MAEDNKCEGMKRSTNTYTAHVLVCTNEFSKAFKGDLVYAGHYECCAKKALKGCKGSVFTWQGGRTVQENRYENGELIEFVAFYNNDK